MQILSTIPFLIQPKIAPPQCVLMASAYPCMTLAMHNHKEALISSSEHLCKVGKEGVVLFLPCVNLSLKLQFLSTPYPLPVSEGTRKRIASILLIGVRGLTDV